MLMRGEIDLEDAAYRGRKSSRAAVFGEADDDDEEDDGEGSSSISWRLSDRYANSREAKLLERAGPDAGCGARQMEGPLGRTAVGGPAPLLAHRIT